MDRITYHVWRVGRAPGERGREGEKTQIVLPSTAAYLPLQVRRLGGVGATVDEQGYANRGRVKCG